MENGLIPLCVARTMEVAVLMTFVVSTLAPELFNGAGSDIYADEFDGIGCGLLAADFNSADIIGLVGMDCEVLDWGCVEVERSFRESGAVDEDNSENSDQRAPSTPLEPPAFSAAPPTPLEPPTSGGPAPQSPMRLFTSSALYPICVHLRPKMWRWTVARRA